MWIFMQTTRIGMNDRKASIIVKEFALTAMAQVLCQLLNLFTHL